MYIYFRLNRISQVFLDKKNHSINKMILNLYATDSITFIIVTAEFDEITWTIYKANVVV